MRDAIKRIIRTAENETGYLEKASNEKLEHKTANSGRKNYSKYGEWYGVNPGAWCAMFVSWCANKAGLGENVIPCHASCADGIGKFKKLGRWKDKGTYDPSVGDIVYFTENGAVPCHVGIVYGVDETHIYTIEGNTSGDSSFEANGGCVARKSYSKGNKRILGYANPLYPEDEMSYEDFLEYMKRYEDELKKQTPSDWSAEARKWAEKNGIIKGDGTGMNYCVPLTREEYVTMQYRQRSGAVE